MSARPTCSTCRFFVAYKTKMGAGRCFYHQVGEQPQILVTDSVVPRYYPGLPSDVLDMGSFCITTGRRRCDNHTAKDATP